MAWRVGTDTEKPFIDWRETKSDADRCETANDYLDQRQERGEGYHGKWSSRGFLPANK